MEAGRLHLEAAWAVTVPASVCRRLRQPASTPVAASPSDRWNIWRRASRVPQGSEEDEIPSDDARPMLTVNTKTFGRAAVLYMPSPLSALPLLLQLIGEEKEFFIHLQRCVTV
ncbi:hypothetical protein VTJ04DRAFT_775 [Mycothermus thermophilus]|uniref:uncharacterized protein n=1 Tax=Humicola insolens TaxID=85995 RepID=UPI0037449B2A